MQNAKRYDTAAPCVAAPEPHAHGAARNRYFGGKLMNARDFAADQNYLVSRRRLINRAMFGPGVVYGLGVRAPGGGREGQAEQLEVGVGLAFDDYGREIAIAEPLVLKPADMQWMGDAPRDGHWLLVAHYAERLVEPVRIPDPCGGGCGEAEWNRTCEAVVLSLRPVGETGCQVDERSCPRCGCPDARSWRRDAADGRVTHEQAPTWKGRDACLCCWAEQKQAGVAGEPGPLCEWRPGICADLGRGVSLACVEVVIGKDECPRFVLPADECTPRRIVKRNDLLYDLIRGCDLTRLNRISWGDWHRREAPVRWNDFAACFPRGGRYSVTGFMFEFTGPVLTETVTPDAVVMTAIIEDGETEVGRRRGGTLWGQVRRVPVVGVSPIEPPEGDPPGTARAFAIVVLGEWVERQIYNDDPVEFDDGPSTIEIELRGDLILDCRGQAVDANTIGDHRGEKDRSAAAGRPLSGNGAPGGTFLSPFHVARRPDDAPRAPMPEKPADGGVS